MGTELWLKADSGVEGSTVSLWRDQSGNGRDAKQDNSSYQPSYQLLGENFNPTFTYSNHFLDVPYVSTLNGHDLTVFAVVHQEGGSGYRSPWTTRDDYPQRGHILYYQGDKYQYWSGEGDSGWEQLYGVDTTGEFEIVTVNSKDASSEDSSQIEKKFFLQGLQMGDTQLIAFSPNTEKPFRVGKGATEKTEGDYPWAGDISEIIVYSEALSDLDRNHIESYLAIKYGITLDQSSSTLYPDYRDSFGNIIWSHSNNLDYLNDIAGLGVDSSSELNQKVSKSIHRDAIVTMATSNDFSSSNLDGSRLSLGEDRSFLIWSNNDGASTWSSSDAPMNGKILNRVWKVQKTGIQNHVSIQVDVDNIDFDIEDFTGKLYFVKGDDLSKAYPLEMQEDGSLWSIEDIEFQDGEYFSFVSDVTFPQVELTKSSFVISDPINGTTNPKRIMGATIEYRLSINNIGDVTIDDPVVEDIPNADYLEWIKESIRVTAPAINGGEEKSLTDAVDEDEGSFSDSKVLVNCQTLQANESCLVFFNVKVK
jgi:hypothetical protein